MAAIDTGVFTYEDLVDYAASKLGGAAKGVEHVKVKEAVLGGLRDIRSRHRWGFYDTEYRIDLSANYNTGTISYDHTGHAQGERMLILSDGAWPSWIKYGRVRISNIIYPIADTTADAAVVQLSETFNPGADVAASTTYQSFRSVYPLPSELWSLESPMLETGYWSVGYITPSDWMKRERFQETISQPWAWTLMKDPDNRGQLSIWMDPSPSTSEPLGFIYHRRPRPMRWTGKETQANAATASGTAAASTLTTSATLDASFVGSIIRLSIDTTNLPTGLSGTNPFIEQHEIKSIASTTVTLQETTLERTHGAGTKITVSDPVDAHESMVEAIKSQIDYRIGRMYSGPVRGGPSLVQLRAMADDTIRIAMENDSRVDETHHMPFMRMDFWKPTLTSD